MRQQADLPRAPALGGKAGGPAPRLQQIALDEVEGQGEGLGEKRNGRRVRPGRQDGRRLRIAVLQPPYRLEEPEEAGLPWREHRCGPAFEVLTRGTGDAP